MTDAERNEPPTKGDIHDLADVVEALSAKYRWTLVLSIAVAVAVVFAGVAIGLGAVALVQLRHENACVASLAAASADRTGVLAPLATGRTNAQDARQDAESALILTLIPTSPAETKAERAANFTRALQVFHTAADSYALANRAYERAYAANPPPKAPSFHC